uniref:DNA topoisomerase 3-beta-1 n=1 Tax=Lygus hesperus TaxID=30085 RepID=A0A0A9WVC9_LYGHE
MGASFAPLAESGKPITRCGNCMRYLKHISTRPQRLYCSYCEMTFALPQGGSIKQYSSFKCPLDNFELVICHIDGGKSMPICPNCYNNPPFEDAITPAQVAAVVEQRENGKYNNAVANPNDGDNDDVMTREDKNNADAVKGTHTTNKSAATVRHMACDECRHPTCEHSLATNYICDCIDETCPGSMAFVPHTAGQ